MPVGRHGWPVLDKTGEDFFWSPVVSGEPVTTKGYDDGRAPPDPKQEEP